jgi:hypothetical protein
MIMTMIVIDESGQASGHPPRNFWGNHLPAWASAWDHTVNGDGQRTIAPPVSDIRAEPVV